MTLDERQLEELYYRYSQRLRNFAVHLLGDESAAEDVVHDSFIRFWNRYKGRDENYWAPLLFTVVRAGCIDSLRHRSVRRKVENCDLSALEGTEKLYSALMASAEDSTIYEELRRQVNQILESLPPRCREVFVLSRLKGLRNREIADLMGISEQAVKNQISKALRVFRKEIGGGEKMDPELLSFAILFLLLV